MTPPARLTTSSSGRLRPLVDRVVRASRHDGPGLRTVVFFKGCGLRCVFCHSPQTQDPRPEIAFHAARCLACGRCVSACPTGALSAPGELDRGRCARCGACAEACPSGALELVGHYLPPETLAARLRRDLPFYRASGGGVTLSGGEPLLHPRYLLELLDALNQDAGEDPVHVAVETGGHFAFHAAEPVLRRVHLVLFDLKLADEAAHRRLLGRSNRRVLANLRALASWQRAGGERPGTPRPALVVRTPVIPGVTDSEANLRAVLVLARDAGVWDVRLLPYNPAGLDQYEPIGRRPPALPAHFIPRQEWQDLLERFRRWRDLEPEPGASYQNTSSQ